MRPIFMAPLVCVALLTACSLAQQAKVASFEQTASADIQKGCAAFRNAEANPLVQVGVAAGSTALTATTGVPAGLAVGAIKSFGDAYCQSGPPAGDTTTTAQQVAWLGGVTQQMLTAAGAVTH